MRPRFCLCAADDWPTAQLRALAKQRRVRIVHTRTTAGWLDSLDPDAPTVAILQAGEGDHDFAALAQAGTRHPQAIVIVMMESKLHEDVRPQWSTLLHTLGAAVVLYPPFTAQALNDLVASCLDEARQGHPTARVAAIDLADELDDPPG